MNFCTQCNFMLYTKVNPYNTNKLLNYCRNCGWEGDYQKESEDESICVYKKQYSNEFLAQKKVTNKFTRLDPTLPRVNNIPCVNSCCLSNIDITKTLYIKTDDETIEEKVIPLIDSDTVTVSYHNNSNQLTIVFTEQVERDGYYNNLNGEDDNKNIEIEGKMFHIKKYTETPPNEIIFIKYDYTNLKYLYLCSNCDTSWNTE